MNEPLTEDQFNVDQRFVVVTNGIDRDTLEAIKYWKTKGLNIDCITYKLYEIHDAPYIQFDTYDPEFEPRGEGRLDIYIVNTNSSYMPEAWQDMLGDSRLGKAAAYYDRKWAIQRIQQGSTVYLYHTGVGIIAKATAIEGYQIRDCNGDSGEEYYIPLQFEWALQNMDRWPNLAVKAWEVNTRMGTGHRFRPTVMAIPEAMRNTIDTIWGEHNQVG